MKLKYRFVGFSLFINGFIASLGFSQLATLNEAKKWPLNFEEAQQMYSTAHEKINKGDLETLRSVSGHDEGVVEDFEYWQFINVYGVGALFDCSGNRDIFKCNYDYRPYSIEFPRNLYRLWPQFIDLHLNECKTYFRSDDPILLGQRMSPPVFIEPEQFKMAKIEYPRMDMLESFKKSLKMGFIYSGFRSPKAIDLFSFPEFIQNDFHSGTYEFSLKAKVDDQFNYIPGGMDIRSNYRKANGLLVVENQKEGNVYGYSYCYRQEEPFYCTTAAVSKLRDKAYLTGNVLYWGDSLKEAREGLIEHISTIFNDDTPVDRQFIAKLNKNIICSDKVKNLDLKVIVETSGILDPDQILPPQIISMSKLKRLH